MEIIVDDLSGPEIAAFLTEHVRDMLAITPLESKHALDLDAGQDAPVGRWPAVRRATRSANAAAIADGRLPC